MVWIIVSLAMFVICVGLVLWFWHKDESTSSSNWMNPKFQFNLPAKLVSSVMQTPGLNTKIVFNGQEFSRPEDMPADIRQAYDQVMNGVLVDSNKNGIPDIAEGGAAQVFDLRNITTSDPAERLKKLNEMHDAGLITSEEYETKRAEIITLM